MLLGPLPTPAVAMLTRSAAGRLGVMISASHNPFEDNGIKLFGPDGYKLSDDAEARDRGADGDGLDARPGRRRPNSAARKRIEDARGRYIEVVQGDASRAADASTGCGSWSIAPMAPPTTWRPTVLWELGAEVVADRRRAGRLQHQRGVRLHPPGHAAPSRCVEHGADLGIALDGDADRVVIVRRERRRSSTATRSWRWSPEPGTQTDGCAAAAWWRR